MASVLPAHGSSAQSLVRRSPRVATPPPRPAARSVPARTPAARQLPAGPSAANQPTLRQPTQPTWSSPFSPDEAQRLLNDDRFAGTAISIILVSIFLMGLLLTIGAIWLAR